MSDQCDVPPRFRFYANIYAMPHGVTRDSAVMLRGAALPILQRGGRAPTFDAYHSVAFEEVLDALARLPRVDAEPDGFFVIAGDLGDQRWQLDGHLFDFGGRLHRLELHGSCPRETLDAILAALGWPASPLAFELVREGVVLDEAAFRAFAAR